jgi:hypothetical protein
MYTNSVLYLCKGRIAPIQETYHLTRTFFQNIVMPWIFSVSLCPRQVPCKASGKLKSSGDFIKRNTNGCSQCTYLLMYLLWTGQCWANFNYPTCAIHVQSELRATSRRADHQLTWQALKPVGFEPYLAAQQSKRHRRLQSMPRGPSWSLLLTTKRLVSWH